ncbi:hypothetical protein ElyMa_000251300 [Elysia marginata]|uniref:GOLD domain-containing protein n=1 Tax=Elysia marginata TaxID=1093978 RepID=A0AAV4F2T3_9GAST|nr:hypothetical protein ElyMa_000251300 [Elysia marginata]
MSKSLYEELKRVGIDETLAYDVSLSLDPDHNASKKDILMLQEAILQVQLTTESRYHELKHEISEVRSDLHKEIAGVRTEMASLSRQFWITFGGLITTIMSVFFVNWYFHQ